VLSGAAWLVLLAVAVWRLACARAEFLSEARSPAALTGVAASAVLGSRVVELGWTAAAIALLVLAAVSWLAFFPAVLRRVPRPAPGQWFLLTVATEGIAALAAALGSREHAGWLGIAGLVFALAGLACHPLVLTRFDLRELRRGRGDQWIAGGSLAISALAFAQLAVSAHDLAALHSLAGALKVAAFVIWVAAIAWLPVLIAPEVLWPRLGYDARRWSTVFPFGMYAACSLMVANSADAPALADFGRGWMWVALACWGVVAVGLARRGLGRLGRRIPHGRGGRQYSGLPHS
jgi:tellurite resistance protein TehA-like permease